MSDLIDALLALRDSRGAYQEAEDFYEGEVPERFMSETMAKLFGGGQSDYFVNLAQKPVVAVLDRLEIAAFTCPDEGATKVLAEQVWDANELDIEAPEIHERALTYGDAYLFVWEAEPPEQDEDGEEPAEDEASPGRRVDVFYNSPLSVRVLYDDEQPRRKRLAIKSWCVVDDDGKERTRVNLYYPDRCEKWISKANSEADRDDDFEPYVDEHTDENGEMPNPYGEIPFFHFRTRRPYGRPEHKNAYGPQNGINKLITLLMSTADFDAFPQRYGLVESGAGTDDDTDWGEDETTDPEDRESALISRPGSLWALRHYKEVGQFQPSNPSNFLEPLSAEVRLMAAATTTPYRWFDPTGGVPSGESIRADDAPLVKKINARQRSFGATWSDAGQFALKILGIVAVPTVRWAPPQIINDLDGWQAILAKQDAGVTTRQTLLEAGYTEAEVTSWGYTEDEPNGPEGLGELPPEVLPPPEAALPAGEL